MAPLMPELLAHLESHTGARATIAVQVYPQGNQSVGLVFRSSKSGYYLFRVFRNGNNSPEQRQLLRYDANNGKYTKLIGDATGKG